MATTTNYSWVTPDDTSLVKDGASAIRTLGSSIDTTTKALNPSTTLGDIEYRSSTANTNTRLGIGTTGQVLSVSGGVPAWATPAAGGGMTLLSTTSLTGATTTISGINGSYKDLRIEILNVNNTGGTGGSLRIAPNGTTNITTIAVNADGSVYKNVNTYLYANGFQNYSTTGTDNVAVITINNYASATESKAVSGAAGWVDGTPVNTAASYGGWIKTTSAISSLAFTWTAGDNEAGTVRLYGIN